MNKINLVTMETCSGRYDWGRSLEKFGHVVRLVPPAYVKPFVKSSKKGAVDAEAICEAEMGPKMRCVAVKSKQ